MSSKLLYSTDSTFHIGQIHVNHISPCQDFADNFVTKEHDKAFLVVSDGCSSGGQTDIGSRLMARKLLKQAKHFFASNQKVPPNLGWYDIVKNDLDFLALCPQDAYATALSCHANQDTLSAHIYGDGAIAFIQDDGTMRLERLEWQNNTPFYPIYASRMGKELGLYDGFINEHKNVETPFTQTTVTVQGGQVTFSKNTAYPLELGISGVKFKIEIEELSHLKLVALFSDGISQISDLFNRDQLDWISVVRECLAFKNTTGDFVKRRVRRAIQNWKTLGLLPQDDIACSVLLIEKESLDEKEE